MDLDLGCVADFLAVLAEGSYRRAAVQLHESAPGLSRRIQRLERQVGVPLVVRGPAGTVGATAAGFAFVAQAPGLLEAARVARELARAPAPPVVRLGIPGGWASLPGPMMLSHARRRFQLQAAGVRLMAVAVPLPTMYDALLEGAVDVLWAVIGPTPPAMEVSPAGSFDRMAIIPPHHPLADGDRLSVAELVDVPLERNPAIPSGWMSPFVLGDLRPVRHARFVESRAASVPEALRTALQEGSVAVGAAWLATRGPSPLRWLPVDGLPEYPVGIGRRRSDRRGPVLALSDSVAAQQETWSGGLPAESGAPVLDHAAG